MVKTKVSLDAIESKVLNERKISIKATLKVNIEVFEEKEVKLTDDFNQMEGVEKLKETVDIKSLVGKNKVKTSIKEDISVDNSFSVLEILKTDIKLENIENKISYNKVLAKADANVKIVFLSEDGRIGIATSNIPVMSFIDIEGVTDTHDYMTEYTIRNMLFKVNSKESHSITCQIEFEVLCSAYDVKTIDVIQDMYGIKNDLEFTKKEIEVPVVSNNIKEKININETVAVEDILNIFDVDITFKKVNFVKSGNMYNHEYEANFRIYYEADSRNGLNVKDVTIPFIVKLENDSDIEFEIGKKEFTVNNENVNFDVEIFYKKDFEKSKNISVIENVEFKDLTQDEDYKMFMYFVKPGDTIWNIAKMFKVRKEDIIKNNKIENENKINVGDRLYIMR